ncbi:multicopper oxidase family protein [Pseudomonas benzenivorans]|uniref:Multicopper oxidase CueO n=1 Tax=Pseudomonas benzenivorans TaxID=556533 RepID=A0ABY5H2S0_9PSED|nr:multicopper oxidase domain-containing protein [Pseudomonas benzenivorans]UTW06339.1 multicopper oxidase domain-containing protein [Pseudomonas benzenivorans]
MKKNGKQSTRARSQDTPEGPDRRSFLKLSAAAMASPLLLGASDSEGPVWITTPQPVFPPSPPTRPWMEELPREIVPIPQEPALTPPAEAAPKFDDKEAGREPHQRFDEIVTALGGPTLYELTAKEIPWSFHPDLPIHPDLPRQTVWTYVHKHGDPTVPETRQDPAPTFPSTIVARYGKPVVCRFHNELPKNHQGFGSPEISTHLHNLHMSSGCDGYPSDYYREGKAGPTLKDIGPNGGKGTFKDHFYPNVYAGYDDWRAKYGVGIGDPNEALGTLWFHDHTEDFTAPNVYRGLAGFYLLFDPIDSGDEADPSSTALRLPSGPYDYPLAFGDKRFDPQGYLFWDEFHVEGVLGDKVTVNGKIEPVLPVDARKYRLRLLNTGPSRFYEFYLVDGRDREQTFTYIANDGNLLPAPLFNQRKVRIAVAERADIVVDFSRYPIGTALYLVNRLRQDSTRKPKDVKKPGTRVLKFVVDRPPPQQDLSQVPNALRELPPLPKAEELATLKVRRWEFDRKGGLWTVNGRLFDRHNPRARIDKGAMEIWELVGKSGGWSHPIHLHLEEGRILSKSVDGVTVPIPPHERGRKDVFELDQTMTIKVLVRFRDFTGKYVMHCHNVIHEDHAMMVRWDVEDKNDA